MSKFKVGDMVKVINDEGVEYIKEGEVYEVAGLNDMVGDCIYLQDNLDKGYYAARRFELVKEKSKLIDNQDHYKKAGVEPIDLMKQNFTKEEYSGFLQGNIIKYLLRFKRKNGVEDLKKALTYLTWLIEQEEK